MDLALKANTDAGGGHDLAIVNGDLALAVAAEGVRQDIEMALRTFLGESVYDKSAGVPYLEVIFERGTTPEAVRFIIEQQILARKGVAQVLELNTRRDAVTREATISGRVRLDTGEVIAIGAKAAGQ